MKNFILGLVLLLASGAAANSLSQIRQNGVVKVGVFEAQPPFSKFDEGKFEGFEVTLAEALSKDIFDQKSGRVEFVPVKANERIKVLETNKVDMVLATFTITSERKRQVDFTTPYFSVNIGVLTNVADSIETLADLNGKPIIAESGTTGEAYFKNEGFNVVNCATANECYRMLKDGKGAGYATDNLLVLAYAVIDSDTEVNIKNLGVSEFLGIAVSKGNKDLLDFLNGELIKLSKEGFMKKTYNETIEPYYKGTAEKKYFLLDDLYNLF